ncbi:MAG: DUF3999 family protein [Verrucomicrobia bacterium]|nr:DUF3999 family protein [Verrucomicrobiota bacterium]MBU4247250.1 DUF3999 family protein [Verrucomicrobiota bacterium]MBU4289944.1 DUF3999 family protein [Verrucomicrobiota bacterium]MBU4498061.1 DUF3999 family protein [Verrucomicrobiota bacterium]MCG2679708.1 DUF3999 family protein [Kiritimatiellia bacterium]
MNRAIPIISLLIAAGSLPAADLRPFPFYRELQPPASGAGDVASVVLDRPIYAASDGPRVDLRIIDQDNRETPFHVRTQALSKSTLHETPFPAEVLSFRELPDNRVEIIARRNARQPVPAGLRIHTSKRNFEKQVTVYGSADREQWTLLAEAIAIFDYSRFIDVRNDRIAFEPREFVFYKIEVANITETRDSPLTEIIRKYRDNAETETTEINAFRKESFRLDRLEFLEQKEIAQSGDTETREEAVREWIAVPDAQRRQTVLTFSATHEPLTALTLETRESNFSRPVVVSVAETPKGPWTELAAGRISRIDAGKVHQQSLTIPLNGERRHRHYRVIIENQDNPPLTITGIRARENLYQALFFPKPGCRYRLYYGGSGGPASTYDTETVLSAILPGATLAWAIGNEQKNPEFKPGTRSSINSKNLLIAAIIVMVGVLAWVMVRITRKVECMGRD